MIDTQRRVSSRLIKNERNKMVRQIFWFGGLAVILVLGFIFIVLPLFIRFLNAVLNTNPISEEEQVLLQPPVLSAPVEATNSAQFKISGYDAPEHEVVIVLNGQEFKRVTPSDDGSFSADLELTEGENSIGTYAVDQKDNESKVGQTFTVLLDTDKPKLELSEPQENAEISSKDRQVTIAGTTDPSIRVYVNDRIVFANAEGAFSTKFALSDGKNELTLRAIDDAGNQTELKRVVNYSP